MTVQEMNAKYGTPPTTTQSQGGTLANRWKTPESVSPSLGERVSADIKNAGEEVESSISGTGSHEGETPIRRGVEAVASASGAPLKVASELLPQSIRSGLETVSKAGSSVVDWLGDKLGDTKLAQDFVTKHPEAAKTLEEFVGTGKALGTVAGNILATGGTAKVLEKGTDVAPTAVKGVKDIIAKGKAIEDASLAAKAGKVAEDQALGDLTKITDTIAPKLNAAETKVAINEGRVTRTPDSGIKVTLFGKRPDIVTQSDEIQNAAKTIQQQIPNAGKMSDVELHRALDSKVTELAKNLGAEMEGVKVKPDMTGKVVNAWKNIKNEQIAEPEYDAFPGSAKAQAKFESYLKQLEWDITDSAGKFKSPTTKTLGDIWDVRKAYDESIAPNVKSATSASSPSLQWQKTMWLQNRALLNSAINDATSGLGETSQKAFKEMSDMYMAQQNILSKAKIDVKGSEGKIPTNKTDLIKWGLGVGGGAIGLDIVLHKMGL